MPHYGITRIRLNAQGTHIDAVEYRAIIRDWHGGLLLGPPIQLARLGIVDIVHTPGNHVITLPRAPDGKYHRGQPVFVEIGPHGIEYLESVVDGIQRNHLRALPTF